jgi:hypothetical protein
MVPFQPCYFAQQRRGEIMPSRPLLERFIIMVPGAGPKKPPQNTISVYYTGKATKKYQK